MLSVPFMAFVCSVAPIYGYSPILSAFVAGVFLPSKGRSKWGIGNQLPIAYHFLPNVLFFGWGTMLISVNLKLVNGKHG